jgi:ATP-dependent exoDNAse (exonuclease V) beta subunit
MPKFYDNSRRTNFETCNRYYYWRDIRDLRQFGKAPALDFGTSWHAAMDTLWVAAKSSVSLTDMKIVELAHGTFNETWEGLGHPSLENMSEDEHKYLYKARNPETAFFMLVNYYAHRKNFIQEVELLEKEKPFAVPLDISDKETFYVGRLDKTIRWNGRVWVVEHKTTSWGSGRSGISSTYLESFDPNSQVEGYQHAGRMYYGKAFKGVLIDAALVYASCHDKFALLPIESTWAKLDQWLWETKRQFKLLEINKEALKEVKKDDEFMAAFPRNTKNCIQFMRPCSYMDLCKTIPNPASEPDRIPMGFAKDHWSPIKHLNLGALGIEGSDD